VLVAERGIAGIVVTLIVGLAVAIWPAFTTAAVRQAAFAKAVSYQVTGTYESHVDGIVLVDLDADGRPDVVTADYANADVAVLLNNGTGVFGPQTLFATSNEPKSIVSADFDGDGLADVAVPSEASSKVSVLLGNGSGGFSPHVDFTAGTTPHVAAVGDFNRDGRFDLAVVNDSATGAVTILIGTGTGGFKTSPVSYSTSANPRSVAVGDFNGDGSQDLAIALEQGGAGVLLGDGLGHFATPIYFAAGTEPKSVAVGDLNGDGHDDIVVVNEGDDVTAGSVSVLLGDGQGGLAPQVPYPVGVGPKVVTLGDLNSDGTRDIVVGDYIGDNIAVLLGRSDGTFEPATFWPCGNGPKWVAVGDVNGDRIADLAVADNDSGMVAVLVGQRAPGGDTTPPVTTDSADALYHRGDVPVTLTATDLSGVAGITHRVDGNPTWTTVPSSSTVVTVAGPADHSGDGLHTIDYCATDTVGNVEAVRQCTVNIDTVAPTSSATVPKPTSSGWYTAPVTITLKASDTPAGTAAQCSGVASITYGVDAAAPVTTASSGSLSVTVSGDGAHTLRWYSTDAAGNIEMDLTAIIRIDTGIPSTTAKKVIVKSRKTATFKFSVADPMPSCGSATVTIKIARVGGRPVKTLAVGTVTTNTRLVYRWKAALRKGKYVYRVPATDAAGNVATSIGSGVLIVK
jgi:hypothetical protein